MAIINVPANYYQQFDADFTLEVPAEAYGGWKKTLVPLSLDHTAVVVMHAWDCGTFEEYPGVHRCCEYIPRSYEICRTVFPRLLAAVRASALPLFHVLRPGGDYEAYPGYRRAAALAGPPPPPRERVATDEVWEYMQQFSTNHCWPGEHNIPDRDRWSPNLDFPDEARPQGDEGMAESTEQLFALCKEAGVNHLIYAGFAIDGCLLMSPGGMIDMWKHGVICSAFRQAVTAVETKETARTEMAKEIGLWRVASTNGVVFDVDDFVKALESAKAN